MSCQPEALRLAEYLDGCVWYNNSIAAELRRQHAEIERLRADARRAVDAEREACAKVAEGVPGIDDEEAYYGRAIAAAIRARSNECKS